MAPGPQQGTEIEVRQLLASRQLPPYRDVDGNEVPFHSSPGASSASVKRFLVGRKGDARKAADMLEAHLHWRRRAFPILRQGRVAQLLDDGKRYYRLGTCTDGVPLLVIDFLWGYFLTEEATPLDCLRAALRFMEEEIGVAEREENMTHARVLSFGGPPPISFASALGAILEANYPERLLTGVIYPVPRMIRRIVFAMLWFLDETTRSKVSVESEESTMLELMRYPKDQLPREMRGGIDEIFARFNPDSSRMNRLVREGLLQNRGAAGKLQQQLFEEAGKDAMQLQGVPGSRGDQRAAGNDPATSCGFFADWFDWQLSCCVARDNRGGASNGKHKSANNTASGGKYRNGAALVNDTGDEILSGFAPGKPGRPEVAPSGASCGTVLLKSAAIGIVLIAFVPYALHHCLGEFE